MKTQHALRIVCMLSAALLSAVTSGAQPLTQVAAGGYHSLFLKSGGSLWTMGYNFYGELGDGTYYNTNRPEQIVASNVTAIAVATTGDLLPRPPVSYVGEHSLFLKSDGSLWAMGFNYYGELGDGTYSTNAGYGTNRPEQIVSSNVIAIAAGENFSLFLKSDGGLWAMGYNFYGELGDGTYTTNAPYGTNRPEQIVSSNVTAIAAGQNFSLFLKSDGSLWAMGYNNYGQLGDGTYNNTNQPEMIVSSNVTAIAAGENFSLFLKSDGSLWAMGWNNYGQLGDGTDNETNQPEQIFTNVTAITAIAAGAGDSLFLKTDGSLWGVGWNEWGQLGDGTHNQTNRPEQIVAGGVTAVTAGWGHSLFLRSDGSLWAMGYDNYGQLGDGTYNSNGTNRPEQIVAGPPGYSPISIQLLSDGDARFAYVGMAGTNYALIHSFSLMPASWTAVVTNRADSGGLVLLTNTPDTTTNNFWRIRSVP